MNDYWQEWNTTFATARTDYNTKMAARDATIANSQTVLIEGVDYESTLKIITDTMYRTIGAYFGNNSVPTYFTYSQIQSASNYANFSGSLMW